MSDNDNKRPAVTLMGTPNKMKKFGRKSSPGSATSTNTVGSSTNQSLVKVTLIQPTTNSDTMMCGMLVTPTGFMADKHLGDILATKASDNPKAAAFIEKTGVIPFIVYAKSADGSTITKMSRGKFYPVQSAFIPLDDTEVTDKDCIKKKVNTLSFSIMKYIRDDLPGYYANKKDKGASEMPMIKDWDTEVRTVSTFSEAISDRNDTKNGKTLYMVLHLSLKSADNDVKDWLNNPGDNNIYSIFKTGEVDFEWFQKKNLPFECLNNEDKAEYKKWCELKTKNQRKNDEDDAEFDVAKYFGFEDE